MGEHPIVVVVADRKPGHDLVLAVEAAGCHLHRFENVVLDIVEVTFAGDVLDDATEQNVAGVAVAQPVARLAHLGLAGDQRQIVHRIDVAFGVLEIVRHHEVAQARGMVQEFPHRDLLRHRLVGIFRNQLRQRVVPRQLAGLDQLRDGDRGEHLADRADAELRLLIDRHIEATFGKTTALVEHGLAAIENGHATGEVGHAYQSVQYDVYLFSQLRMRHQPLGPVGIKRIVHRDQVRLGEQLRMRRVGGQPEQGGLRAVTSLDGDFEQSRLVRIGAHIEYVQAAAITSRRNQICYEICLVVRIDGQGKNGGCPLPDLCGSVGIDVVDQLTAELADRRVRQARCRGRSHCCGSQEEGAKYKYGYEKAFADYVFFDLDGMVHRLRSCAYPPPSIADGRLVGSERPCWTAVLTVSEAWMRRWT